MAGFFASLFGGNKRKEETEYTDFLISEMEKLKAETQEKLDLNNTLMEGQKTELLKAKEEIEKLQKQLDQYKEENQKLASENKDVQELNSKVDKYEESYSAFLELVQNTKADSEKTMSDAKTKAEWIVTDAKSQAELIVNEAKTQAELSINVSKADAEKVLEDAKKDADTYRRDVEFRLDQKMAKYRAEYSNAKKEISSYIKSLTKVQDELIEVHERLGSVLKDMPLGLRDDIFKDEPVKRLKDGQAEVLASKDDDEAKAKADKSSAKGTAKNDHADMDDSVVVVDDNDMK